MARSTMRHVFVTLALVAALYCGGTEARTLDSHFKAVALGVKAASRLAVPAGSVAETAACTSCKEFVAAGESFLEDPANIAMIDAEVKTLCAKTGAEAATVRHADAYKRSRISS